MKQQNEFGQILGDHVANWKPRPKPKNTILKGKYTILEPMDINRHASYLFDALAIDNQGESWTYLPYGPFANLNEFKDWLEKIISTEQDTFLYAILDGKTDKPIGISGYLRITPQHGVIEIGHLHFSHLLKRSPAATEAIYLMLSYAFDELGYRRCEWKCNALNEPSRNAAKRFGFQFEGIFRQNFVFKNRNRDTAWFSIIDHEWPLRKEKFVKWLHPNNFAVDGKQILKLAEM
jgi:RimJ/RimL family protein N-acetyltransferase